MFNWFVEVAHPFYVHPVNTFKGVVTRGGACRGANVLPKPGIAPPFISPHYQLYDKKEKKKTAMVIVIVMIIAMGIAI